GVEQPRQDSAAHAVIIDDQDLWMCILRHLYFGFGWHAPLHCMRAAFYQAMFGSRRKSDLIVGNDSDYGYDYKKFSFMMKFSLPLALLAAFCSPRALRSRRYQRPSTAGRRHTAPRRRKNTLRRSNHSTRTGQPNQPVRPR